MIQTPLAPGSQALGSDFDPHRCRSGHPDACCRREGGRRGVDHRRGRPGGVLPGALPDPEPDDELQEYLARRSSRQAGGARGYVEVPARGPEPAPKMLLAPWDDGVAPLAVTPNSRPAGPQPPPAASGAVGRSSVPPEPRAPDNFRGAGSLQLGSGRPDQRPVAHPGLPRH